MRLVVADAGRFVKHFGARAWIHADDQDAAAFAANVIRGQAPTSARDGVLAIPVPGYTRGSTVFLVDQRFLFTGDSLAWSFETNDLNAFRDACWYSWTEQRRSLTRLAEYRFEWVLAGHGGSMRLPAGEMHSRLLALVARIKS